MKFVKSDEIISPKLLAFQEAYKQTSPEDRGKFIESFWEEIKAVGTPLFEELDGENDYYLVTFLLQEEVTSNEYRVVCSIFGLNPSRNIMKQIPSTDIYYKSGYVLKNTKLAYNLTHGIVKSHNFFDPEDIPQERTRDFADPLNKFTTEVKLSEKGATYPRSILVTPDAELPPWKDHKELQGRIEKLEIEVNESYRARIDELLKSRSDVLIQSAADDDPYKYKVDVYLPPAFESYDRSFPYILLFDGVPYTHDEIIPGPIILDHLIAHEKIPAIIGIFLSHKNRALELLNNHDFGTFLTTKLIPEVRTKFGLATDPQSGLIGGSSLGGLNAMFMGLHFPDTFGKILCQSGSFWAGTSFHGKDYLHLIREFVEKERVPIKIYLDIGEYENGDLEFGVPSQYWSSYHMRDVLRLKGYEYKFVPFNGGHDYVMWQETLADGLIYLLEE